MFKVLGMYNFGKQSGLHSRNWAFFVEKLTLRYSKLRFDGKQTRKLSCRTSPNYFSNVYSTWDV